MPPVSLLANQFNPSSSLSGASVLGVFRGSNVVVRGIDTTPRMESYLGSKNLNEDYDLTGETLTGTLAWTADDPIIVGTGTLFTTELGRSGRMISADAEVFVVNKIIDDTHFISDRAPSTNGSAKTAYFHPVLNEMDKQRVVLRCGNAIKQDKGDIYLVGDGKLYLNGVDTGFRATRKPKRLQREVDGTYTEYPLGFVDPPPIPTTTSVVGGGTKLMAPGSYSFLASWRNSSTKGFSNPTEAMKPGVIANATDQYKTDFTNSLATKTFVDGDVTIATGNIHIIAHGLITGDSVKLVTSGALPVATAGGGLTASYPYYAIVTGVDDFKLARTSALALAGTPIVYASAAGGGTHRLFKMPANADGFVIWGSLSGGGVVDVNVSLSTNGPWVWVKDVILSDLDANDAITFQYLDAETGARASGDNDPPPDCEFVVEFANVLFWVSALGNITASNKLGASPGKYVIPTKESNREAAPYDWRVAVDSEITGFALGVGRLFLLTPTGVPFITPTGRSQIAQLVPSLLDIPFTSRPFWTKGAISPFNITIIQGDVFSYTGGKPLRSPSNADQNVVPYELGKKVQDLTAQWKDGYVLTTSDPKNQQFCLVSSATKKNAAGYWISEVLPYDLQINDWMPQITLSSNTRDMIVSGVAIVDNRLEFLAGGRVSGGSPTVSTFRYDEFAGVGQSVASYFALSPFDAGAEFMEKIMMGIRATGRMFAPEVQIHCAKFGGAFNIKDLEDGTNATATIPLDASPTEITLEFIKKWMVKSGGLLAVRFADTWPGTADAAGLPLPMRIDELVLDLEIIGTEQ